MNLIPFLLNVTSTVDPVEINPYVFAALASVFIGTMGFFFGQIFKTKTFTVALNKVTESVIKLEATLSGMISVNEKVSNACEERHKAIDKEIDRLRDKK